MSFKINKNGKTYEGGVIPKNYPASNISYNNSQSGLSADNVQGAIDEIADGKIDKSGDTMSGTLQLGDSSTRGELKIIGNDKTHYGRFYNSSGVALSANRNYLLPDKSGTMALVEDFTPVNITSDYRVSGISTVFKVGKLVEVDIEINISAVSHGTEIISKMPKPFGTIKYLNLGMSNGQSLPCVIEDVSGQNYGHLIAYYPTGSQTAARIDANIVYFADI